MGFYWHIAEPQPQWTEKERVQENGWASEQANGTREKKTNLKLMSIQIQAIRYYVVM